MSEKIEVYFKNKHVGTIAQMKYKYVFQYSLEWLSNGFSISPFSLPLENKLFIPSKDNFNGMFGVFSDSLPDSWGRLLLDKYIKNKNIELNEMSRLSFIGSNSMGALEYIPSYSFFESDDKIDLDVFQYNTDLLFSNKEVDIDSLFKFGGSSGGARPKAFVKIDGSDWIIKFQSRYDIIDSGLCEYEYALAAKKVGILMPEVRLFESKINKGYFGVKRFDRNEFGKIHMISVAALLEADYRSPCLDYNDIFKLTKILTLNDINDLKQLYLRMCFNVYSHNYDDHAKNFSFIYDEKYKKYRLSMAYDITYSNTYYNEHTTSINGKGKDILDSDLISIGLKAGLDKNFLFESLNNIKNVIFSDLKKYLK